MLRLRELSAARVGLLSQRAKGPAHTPSDLPQFCERVLSPWARSIRKRAQIQPRQHMWWPWLTPFATAASYVPCHIACLATVTSCLHIRTRNACAHSNSIPRCAHHLLFPQELADDSQMVTVPRDMCDWPLPRDAFAFTGVRIRTP